MDDPYRMLGITYNPDENSLTRANLFPCTSTEDHNSIPNQPVFTQDIPLNPTHKTWLRLFKPINPPPNTKLPLVIYFHGSGFIVCSASNNVFHDFCTTTAHTIPAVILSIEYRLAPENRLPAAYEDAMEALSWVQNQALDMNKESLLKNDVVDFSNCFLMGTSAGGNIAYHAALRALSLQLQPLVIRGLILDQPYFGGQQRTASELCLANQTNVTIAMSDLMWELSLPKGSSRDHEFCDPLSHKDDKIGLLGRCFMSAGGTDILVDREMEFAKMLQANGVDVVTWFVEKGCHGITMLPENAQSLAVALRDFISSSNPIG